MAAALQQRGVAPGERALLVFPPGLDFIRAFWGCVCAGIIPVPAPPIQEARRERTLGRLKRLSEDCDPALTLDPETLEQLKSEPADWQPPASREVAFLQYTSGSTRRPSGVVVTHHNIRANLSMLGTFQGNHSPVVMVHWLPLFHDMGLIRGMLSPLDLGADCYLMDPLEFVQNPATWLHALSHFRATLTGAPNFGYELATERVRLQVQPDLSHLRVAFCSAEPIRHRTVQRFLKRFGPCGLHPGAFKPSYGLAEATVAVSGETGPRYKSRELSLAALRDNRLERPRSPSDTTTLVACGQPLGELEVHIVQNRKSLPPNAIGEVWLRGPSVAERYWKTIPDSEPFRGYLQTSEGPFLRTGDLGFRDHEGSLFITGRKKDLILIRGQNFYPHDIEATLEEELPSLRKGCTVVFQLEQKVGVTCESGSDSPESVVQQVRELLGAEFGLAATLIAVLPSGGTLKTSSGKVQRSKTRLSCLRGELHPVYQWRRPGFDVSQVES